MARVYDPTRRCLAVHEWPETDQRLWHQVTAPAKLLDEHRSRAASWSEATRHKYRRGYGRWICFLKNVGQDLNESPADRVTQGNVTRYLDTLERQGVSPQTVAQRIAELLGVILAFVPEDDWAWLKRLTNHVRFLADDSHETKTPDHLSSEVAHKALRALNDLVKIEDEISKEQAIAYRNWLMVLLLSIAPLRLKNFSALKIGPELRQRAGTWLITVPGRDTKTGRPIKAPLPPQITPFLAYYLESVRPKLLRTQNTERLWITWQGKPMSEHSIYLRVTKFTKKELGQPINPHAFRHMAATSISILNPEEIDTARALLGHSTRTTTEQHYIAADAILASQRHARLIQKLRRTLPGRLKLRTPAS